MSGPLDTLGMQALAAHGIDPAAEPALCREMDEEIVDAVDAVLASRLRCTGLTAAWCPVHGDCSCPLGDPGHVQRHLDNPSCPLHAPTSSHAIERGEASA